MYWIIVSIVSGAIFGHIMRHAQFQRRNIVWVGAWNYASAAAAAWVWLCLQPVAGMNWYAVLLGTLAGASLVAAYFLMDRALRAVGVGVSMSVQWLGFSLPVAASILFWHEIPSGVQALGLGLTAISLPLLTCGPNAPDAPRARKRWTIAFLMGLFLLEGIIGLAMKVYSRHMPAGSELPFLCCMFSSAAVGSILAAWRTAPPRLADMAHGIGMGASNILCNFALMRALTLLSGTVVFPTISAGSVALTVCLGWLLWSERYQGRTLIGLLFAAIALVAINV